MSSIKLIKSMVHPVIWLNQSSKLSLKYMYIYMGKPKLAISQSKTEVRSWTDRLCPSFFLAELFLFITHKSVLSLVLLHLWLPSS